MDVDAPHGSKEPSKGFHGYKRHDAVGMQSGQIDRIAATSGEVTDAAGLDKALFQVGAFLIDCSLKRQVGLGVEPIPID